ncbi:MAG: FUSC family protein, partial [Bacteroidetes bacterium]|nr:FUSC family protein [Bacteroidota bacterium]
LPIVINALYILAGGTWYTLLSLLLYSFRPYKLAQQALGDCIQSTADYLRIKAAFYDKEVDYNREYRRLLEQQVSIHEKQNLVRELLFKSRNIVRESTDAGRILVMQFLDIVDLFEAVMTSQYDYKTLQDAFGKTDILDRFHTIIIEIADALDETGIAVKSGTPIRTPKSMEEKINNLQQYFENFRDEHRTAENVEAFISLRHILENIKDIGERLLILGNYNNDKKKKTTVKTEELEYEKFVTHTDINSKLLKDNFTLKSNIFRHSLRVSIATLTGFIISQFFPFGHSYWILLTVIVILKPAYSLTKKRNYDRLIGTICGALLGLVLLYFVKSNDVLLAFMILFMIATYSFLRTRYLISIVFMTPYILLLFHFLAPHDFKSIFSDRLIDTVIGS